MITRKKFINGLGGFIAMAPSVLDAKINKEVPSASRIKMATVGAPNINSFKNLYTKWLKYEIVEESNVPKEMALSWGAPLSSGKPYVLLRPESGEDVFIRAVKIDPVTSYKAMNSWGWNAIEIICEDVDKIHSELIHSEFKHIGGPANLMGGNSSIRASQYIGPAEEVIYLTCETGDRTKSNLPLPQSDIGRIFIMILAGIDIDEIESFYANLFNINLKSGYRFQSKGGLISQLQNLPEDELFNLGLMRLREKGNSIELDEYKNNTGPRPNTSGQLPPGIAMTTFSVDDLDDLDINFIYKFINVYEEKRSGVFLGPCGELTELIEEKR